MEFQEVQVGYNKFFVDKRYSNLRPIGDGAYGFVASAYDSRTKQKVAIKKIKDAFSDMVDAKRILRELKLLRHFSKHENIISIIDVMTVPPYTPEFHDVYIVTNLMESDLERIISSKQALSDQHYQYFLYQILRALKYIHSANVLHRDLKPSNLLVNANCDLAICDFGLARGFDNDGAEAMTEYVVTRWYRAPELLCECPSYGKPVDVWGVGCIFAELLTHSPFFQGENPRHQLEVILRKIGCPARERLAFIESTVGMRSVVSGLQGKPVPPFASFFPPGCSPLALDLLQRMLQVHPDDRITVAAALEHPYLKDFHGQMPEPSSKRLFDFSFERGQEELSNDEVHALMYGEVLIYRPTPREDCKGEDLKHADSDDYAMHSADEGKGDFSDEEEMYSSMDAS